ncbi:hypothetical protein [Clostridium sp. SM-530-WT-3G]|uniref:hypothetical protein n=1 Tax=Clostridium sp. SM-530-WT-3G TaxID=2725303 RepID=UPI00145F86B8|nr:hypothetical protein [Clostridium sp. SM-530-WT-3G]NME83458.1 hypothetical protein [Clostridium sp. SM-530-WT-3G]
MEENLNINGLDGQEIWQKIYGKELNSKKNILEYIDMTKILKKDPDVFQIESTYNFIYKKIDEMADKIKPNTIMYLKNTLKSQLGKYVFDKDPKIENNFIKFFKEAYPEGHRRKDFTWVLMDLNKIALEQIWTTLTYINRECITNNLILTDDDKKDIVEVTRKLVDSQNIKYINNLKSLDKLNRILNIKIVENRNKFIIKEI